MLFRFPVDRLGGVLLGQTLHHDLLDDHTTPMDTNDDPLAINAAAFEQVLNCLDDQLPVHDLAVYDRFGIEFGDAIVDEQQFIFCVFYFHNFDRAGTYVQPNDRFIFFAEHVPSLLEAGVSSSSGPIRLVCF